MSFGFGVGDIIKAVELCHKLRRDFAEAPRQFQEINEEYGSPAFRRISYLTMAL
jgi:hypothetical protein